MDQHEASFSQRVGERYRARTNTPEFRRDRRRRRMQCLCILLLLPVAILTVHICESYGGRGGAYVPVVAGIVICIARMAGSVAARRATDRDESRQATAQLSSGRRE
jgi:hypothetical protein